MKQKPYTHLICALQNLQIKEVVNSWKNKMQKADPHMSSLFDLGFLKLRNTI